MSNQQTKSDDRTNALDNIIAKCEQYWNEFNICDAEVHAILEYIHREACRVQDATD